MIDIKHQSNGMTRRSFLKTTGAFTAATLAGGALFEGGALAFAEPSTDSEVEEEIKYTVCRGNCDGGCMHAITVRNGYAVNSTAGAQPDPTYTGICLRGLNNVYRTYQEDRIKYPMRRVAGTERGAGEWERISWDEAIDEIAEKLSYYRDTYGPLSIESEIPVGNLAQANGPLFHQWRLSSAIGTTLGMNVADRASCCGTFRVMGVDEFDFSNEPADILNSKTVVVWGTNPVYTKPHVWRFIRMAQDAGAKVITFDPIKSATAHKSDQYIQVVPGSDLAILLGVSNYIIENDLIDVEFLKTRTNGPFLVNRDTHEMYTAPGLAEVMAAAEENGETVDSAVVESFYYVYDPTVGAIRTFGEAADVALEGSWEIDGQWFDTAYTLIKDDYSQYSLEDASEKSGVSVDTLEEFAIRFATAGPAILNTPYGMDHYANGHIWFQAACVMLALTGNFGRPGSGFSGMFVSRSPMNGAGMFTAVDPQTNVSIPNFALYDVWRDQEYNGEPYPLKAMITMGSNPMSNWAEQSRWFTDVFPNMEFWVVADHSWSDSARHADIVLPASFWLEVPEIRMGQNTPYAVYAEQVIEPLWESKADSEICALIGNAMGYEEDFPLDRTTEDWVDILLDSDAARERGITPETMRANHSMRYIGPVENLGAEGAVCQGDQYTPFPTKHARLEIYWEDPAPRLDYGQEIDPASVDRQRIPYWMEPQEVWVDNPLREKYPLNFIQCHERFRTHTQYHNALMLEELQGEPYARISRPDAEARGIESNDLIEVFNDRGHVVVRAIVDDNFSQGIFYIPKGWQRHQFVEGGYSELISSELDPWGVSGSYYDTLAEIRKWNG